MPVVRIATDRIVGWSSFHDVFAEALGFPGFYGRNLDAWRDCMLEPDADDGMRNVVATRGDPLVLLLEYASSFKARCPQIFSWVIEEVASMNLERLEEGLPPLLVLAFDAMPPQDFT